MPANLTPQYLKAEEAYRQAKATPEKVAALEEMIRLLPKHKGTDHLHADLKRKLSRLRDESTQEAKSKKKVFDPYRIDRHGAAQVLLLGSPNTGKSSLLVKLTKAPSAVTPYPFGTTAPVPGMLRFEDVQLQLVDLPPISGELPGGLLTLIKATDAVLLVADLSAPDLLDTVDFILKSLADSRVRLYEPGSAPAPEPLTCDLPCLLIANKVDVPGSEDLLPLLEEAISGRLRPIAISAERGDGLAELPGRVFRMLDLVRIYCKEPGKPPDMESPFTLRRGGNVLDFARVIHRTFPERLREARVWGSARFEGQAVPRDYVLSDKDIVELHIEGS